MLVKWNPMVDFDRFRKDMDRYFYGKCSNGDGETIACWSPRVDIAEKDSQYVMNLDLPGVDPNDVSIDVEKNVLNITGKRESEKIEDGETFKRQERIFGTFKRTFALPDHADTENITANYKNGVLTLTVPKKPEVLPKKIEVSIN